MRISLAPSIPGKHASARLRSVSLICVMLVLLVIPLPNLLADEASARIYRSPEERREAGKGHELTDWLTISGLAEAETDYSKNTRLDRGKVRGLQDSSQAVQLGFDVDISERLKAEVILDYEIDRKHGSIDEAYIDYESESWSLSVGRENIGFGEYFSHFATGPLLEFGETRADALTLSYEANDNLEIFGFIFEGDATHFDRDLNQMDYGGGLELKTLDENLLFGITALSDLAETDEQFLIDQGNLFQSRVSGLNAYLLMTKQQFEVTAEIVTALKKFKDLDAEIDEPSAWNLELAWLVNPKWQLALRAEGSSELEDEPERQFGISASWLLGSFLHVSVDYLYGEYQKGFVTDDDEHEFKSRDFAAIQLSFEF